MSNNLSLHVAISLLEANVETSAIRVERAKEETSKVIIIDTVKYCSGFRQCSFCS